MKREYPERKHPAHLPPLDRFNQPTIVELTVCVQKRKPVLADECVHAVLREIWMNSDYWRVGYYMIMPDHIHMMICPGDVIRHSLKDWAAYWRRRFSVEAERSGLIETGKDFWQRDFWDTQIRNRDIYNEKLEYMRQNPVRAGFVDNADEWPYQGHVFHIRW